MKRAGKVLWLIIIIIALSGLEIMLIRAFAAQKPEVEIFVAAHDISSNQVVSKNLLVLKSYPVDCVPEHVIRGLDQIEGKTALINIKKGEIVSPSNVSEKAMAPISAKDKVLFAIKPEPEDVLAWQVVKGDRVTVLGVTKPGPYDNDNSLRIDNVIVSAIVDTTFNLAQTDPRYVLLEVTVKQAKEMAAFSLVGKLVILRQS